MIGLLILAQGMAGCGDSRLPVSPTPVTSSTPATPSPVNGESIRGTVSDSALRPLAGARVELLDGPQAGVWATSGAGGEFSLIGTVDDATRFRASKEGHLDATATILPSCERCNPTRWVHMYLQVLDAPVDLAGDYTLTLTADRTCTTLPDDMRTRSYAVSIRPWDLAWPGYPPGSRTSFRASPIGTAFPAGLNNFFLNVAGTFINVSFGDHTDPGLTEQLAPDTYLAFNGWAITSAVTPVSTISTPFQGWIDYCVNPRMGGRYDCATGPTVRNARCESSSHYMSLTRR